MIHFRHGQLAHGVFRIFWVAAGEVDILNVAHVEEKDRKVGRWSGLCFGGLSCEECDVMKGC